MRTPNVRLRTVRGGMLLFTLLLLLFDALVFGALRTGLRANLDEVLDQRLEVAVTHATELPADEAAAALRSLGVPATIRTPRGEVIEVEPLFPRLAPGPPGRHGLVPPIESRTATVADGTTVEVHASRAGVDATLNHLLLAIGLGTVVALGLAYWLLRRLVDETMEPLTRIASTAERISDGDLSERLRPDRPETELGRMANAFDGMLDSLETAIAEAEDEQERSRRFLADAAHQLRTPVTGIRTAVELLLRETDPATRDRLLAHTVRETGRIGQLVSDLLQVARLDQGRPVDRVPTDIAALCAEEVERARDLSPHVGIELVLPEKELEPVEIDPEAVSEALANIVDNARRHADEKVTVQIQDATETVAVRVADDGPGVTPGAEDLIFERFATLDGKGGSGLGLPIARGVAQAHGGDLTYGADGFTLRLPRRAATAPDVTPS